MCGYWCAPDNLDSGSIWALQPRQQVCLFHGVVPGQEYHVTVRCSSFLAFRHSVQQLLNPSRARNLTQHSVTPWWCPAAQHMRKRPTEHSAPCKASSNCVFAEGKLCLHCCRPCCSIYNIAIPLRMQREYRQGRVPFLICVWITLAQIGAFQSKQYSSQLSGSSPAYPKYHNQPPPFF